MESPKKFGFRPISGQSRSILWRFSAILHFGATKPDLPLFLLQIRTEAHLLNVAPLVLWFPESYKVFIGTRYSIVTPWEMGLPFSPVFGQIRRLTSALEWDFILKMAHPKKDVFNVAQKTFLLRLKAKYLTPVAIGGVGMKPSAAARQ